MTWGTMRFLAFSHSLLYSLRGPTLVSSFGFANKCTPQKLPAGPAAWRLFSSTKNYDEGQDPSEMFDVYEPPLPEAMYRILEGRPKATGLTKKRSLVHSDGTWHRSVHIWIVDRDGKLLLQRRSEFKDTNPNRWDVSCAGHIESGQDSETTVIRELDEELGIRNVGEGRLKFLFTLISSASGATKRHGKYLCNEYQDIWLYDIGEHNFDLYKPAKGEVSGLKTMYYSELKEVLAKGDDEYVHRPPHYCDFFFGSLDKKFASAK